MKVTETFSRILGVLFLISILSFGYYFSITFVQLGIEEYLRAVLHLDGRATAYSMALLAVVTSVVSVSFGYFMYKSRYINTLYSKLVVLNILILQQAILVWSVQSIDTYLFFLLWVLVLSIGLGMGIPLTYSLFSYLAPRNLRGVIAGVATALTYSIAAGIPVIWSMETFVQQLKILLLASSVGFALFLWIRPSLIQIWEKQSKEISFSQGKFLANSTKRELRINQILIFIFLGSIFFIDSLGFLKLIDTPSILSQTWQSPLLSTHVTIALAHIFGAFVGSLLYSTLPIEKLLLWILGIFIIVHLSFSLAAHANVGFEGALSSPFLYAFAVSLYTVINFAVWPDLSDKKNIAIVAALGVSLSGWLSTFLATSLSFIWKERQYTFFEYINMVDTIAISFFLFGMCVLYIQPLLRKQVRI